METVMKRLTTGILLFVLSIIPALCQNPFSGLTSTKGGYSTWDSDMINIEKVSQTGAGVYIAVLDTGLVPNWRDYFPEQRIATKLGTGFDQTVTFKARSQSPCE